MNIVLKTSVKATRNMAFFLMTKKNDKKLKELRETFDAADKDGDGKLSPAEWLCVLREGGVDATE